MKKIGLIFFLVTLAIGIAVGNLFSWGSSAGKFFNFSVNFKGVKGSGNVAMESRDLRGFDAVDVGGVFQVEYAAQKDFGVEVEADDNLLSLIRTEVYNGILVIKTEKKLRTRNPIKIRISAPDLTVLEVSGAANVTVRNLASQRLTVDASGASKINVEGQTSELTVDVSGATRIDAERLESNRAIVQASGASQVDVQVSGELRADASGASRISYSGTPANVIKHTSGASSVSQR